MYPEYLVAPMRADIVEGGFKELKTASEVDEVLAEKGTTLVFINSVCGCSARTARPGVKEAVWNSVKKPEHLVTVFAGVDQEATQKVREYHLPYPPSSPSVALFKDGELVHFVERHHIEGRSAEMIAGHLEMVFEEFCA
ncbi:BrxA/BrxB family bacilliredoxin [Arcicella rigui]|uniref:BrxA/BrxB family bacilliredoxin n=1 Tax=Arcicella rigui TaxID=797020 RepID=A0ABU5Q838_9BACT|nr:BrxA/BrxB family bacilliredoxin [Arcicella rigui]MEA5139011.1 BrxA/BrxB family bacilliredoxin [Arcicella rigui]